MTGLNSELNEPEKFSKRTSFLRGVKAFGYMGGYILGAVLEDIKTFCRHPAQTLKDLFPLAMQTEVLCIEDYSGNLILDWVNPKVDAWKNNPKGTLAASPMDKTRKAWVLSGFFAAAAITTTVPFVAYQLGTVFMSHVTPPTSPITASVQKVSP